MTQPQHSTFAPLRRPAFLAYWLTGLSGNFGWLIQMVGASWLMASIGGTPEQIALVQTSVALPVMLFALPAGAVADALGRRTIVLWSQSFLLIVSTLLAVCAWLGVLTPWSLLVLTFLVGSGKALNNPGWQTMATELVPRQMLPQAISLTSLGFNIARTVGPALGGLLVAALGAFAAFCVNGLSNLGVILVARRWPSTRHAGELPPENLLGAISSGLRYLALSPNLMRVQIRAAIFNLAGISLMALMPLVARDLLGGGPRTYGLLLGAFGLGGVAGAMLNGPIARRLRVEQQVRGGFVLFAAGVLAVSFGSSLALTLPAAALAGGSWLVTLASFNTTVQMSAPRWVVGRCHALYQTACFAGNALGSWLWGWVATHHSTAFSLQVSAAVLVLGAVLGVVLTIRDFDVVGIEPQAHWQAPQPRLDLVHKSGPMLTVVEYRIAPEHEAEFLALMAKRRRARMRAGARDWTLSRDIAAADLWFERFKTPTWLDMQRLHLRRTAAEASITARLRNLNRSGNEKPRIRYELVRSPAAPAQAPEPLRSPET
ncbi:Predicted arabinose efflux permease, MFS family [Paracoccus pantotrophus]|nr:Predicted arabinose efflux permease, MFS family [Paracoccus pantotrophus]